MVHSHLPLKEWFVWLGTQFWYWHVSLDQSTPSFEQYDAEGWESISMGSRTREWGRKEKGKMRLMPWGRGVVVILPQLLWGLCPRGSSGWYWPKMGRRRGTSERSWGWDPVVITSQWILVLADLSFKFFLILLLFVTLYYFFNIKQGLWDLGLYLKHLLPSHNEYCLVHSRCSVLNTGSVDLSTLASMLHSATSCLSEVRVFKSKIITKTLRTSWGQDKFQE